MSVNNAATNNNMDIDVQPVSVVSAAGSVAPAGGSLAVQYGSLEARAEAELEDLKRESNEIEAAYYAAKSSGKAEDIRKLRDVHLQL